MRKLVFTIFCLSSLFVISSRAQTSTAPVTSFSHFYFVIDSLAYQTLATDKFCTDTLFYTGQSNSATDQGTWTGNYLMGPFDYLEVFHSSSLPAGAVGQIGVGELLHKFYEGDLLLQHWTKLAGESIEQQFFTANAGKDTLIIELLNYRDSMLWGGTASFFVMYYHPPLMLKGGFTQEELTAGVNQQQINQKWYNRNPYQRLYKKTEKIHLQLTPHEYKRHKLALLALGYKEIGKQVFKKDIEINITIQDKPVSRLKKIEFSLTGKKLQRMITLSPNVYIKIEGERGELVME